MVKTYREVLQDIRPGEIWECIESDSIIRTIRYYKNKAIEMECTPSSQSGIFYVDIDKKFKLKKEEVEFEDAIKALKEGKIIESCETLRLCKMDERLIGKKIILIKAINSSVWTDFYTVFKSEEIFGKWHIYNEEEI